MAPGSACSPRNTGRAAQSKAASNGFSHGPNQTHCHNGDGVAAASRAVLLRPTHDYSEDFLSMQELAGAWEALKFGGAMVYPLLALGALALIIMVDRAVVYRSMLRLPRNLLNLVETYEFS